MLREGDAVLLRATNPSTMEIKLVCGCGTKYKFDVEPVNGRMPTRVACPSCGTDGTYEAEAIIAQSIAAPESPPAVPVVAPAAPAAAPVLRISRPAQTEQPSAEPQHGGGHYGHGTGASLLDCRTFFVKERVSALKLTDTYDIFDPSGSRALGIAKEEPPAWAKWLRLLINKSLLPTVVNIYEVEDQPPLVSIQRGITILRAKIEVRGWDGSSLGYFKSKLVSLGGGFHVYDHQDRQVAEVKGNWRGKEFKFLNKGGREIGSVTKKWAGLGKELFTSADNYIIALTDSQTASPENTALLLAAGIAVDIVYKEKE